MSGGFFDAFNSTLADIEGQFTENWIHKGTELPAIAIETLTQDHHTIKGGTIMDVIVSVMVRDEIFNQANVQIGDEVSIRGIDSFVVGNILSDGDTSKTLICKARGIDFWR